MVEAAPIAASRLSRSGLARQSCAPPPPLPGLFSIVVLWANELSRVANAYTTDAAWHPKATLTFIIAAVRREICNHHFFHVCVAPRPYRNSMPSLAGAAWRMLSHTRPKLVKLSQVRFLRPARSLARKGAAHDPDWRFPDRRIPFVITKPIVRRFSG